MKCLFLILLVLFTFKNSSAQSYIGLLTDNFKGVHGVISNPASIADSKYKLDINLGSASAFLNNDFYGIGLLDLLKNNFSIDGIATNFPLKDNNFSANADILGPSVLFPINERSSIAFFTRARFFYNTTGINGSNYISFNNSIDNNTEFSLSENNVLANVNTWGEIGLSLSTILLEKDKHFLKGGVSFKYLKGLGNAYTKVTNFTASSDLSNNEVTTTGNAVYGSSDNFDNGINNFEAQSNSTALGFDIGFVYEWRKNIANIDSSSRGINKYKLKFGLSITDLGDISYVTTENYYDLNNTVNFDNFKGIKEAHDVENIYGVTRTAEAEEAALPTALHFNTDWNINQKFYLNFNTDLSLTSKEKINRSSISNIITLTPRYERKILTLQMPISMQQYSGLQVGAGFRLGPIYAGSGSIITSILGDQSKAADIYLGVKIPLFKTIVEVKSEKKEKEKKRKKKKENNNTKDSDNDSVPDVIDDCPNEYGPVENYGCPETGIDTDGDGIIDKNDNCPNTFGSKINLGCPEVTYEVRNTVNNVFKIILFDTGKTNIEKNNYKALEEIINVIKEYPSAQFSIEGHTDSTGSTEINQKISEKRANEVKQFLIDHGIKASKLFSKGFGETKLIYTNTTEIGRSKNRRVEIIMIK